jgi:hypothetical protein
MRRMRLPRGDMEEDTGMNYTSSQIAATQITPDVQRVTQRRAKMIIRQIKNDWFRLDTEGLVFFGYTQEHVRHKFLAWVREHDLKRVR